MTLILKVFHARMGALAASPRSRAKTSVGVLVAGLHLAGVLAWLSMGHDQPVARSGAALATLTVWLPQLVLPVVEPTRPAPRQATPQTHPGLGAHTVRGSMGDAATPVGSPLGNDSAEMEPAFSGPQGLNLILSRKDLTALAPSGAAASSPFHGRLPQTIERVIANAAAQSDPWIEERIDNDHVRMRRGNTCVMIERPQAAALDPFSDAARRIPWRASPC